MTKPLGAKGFTPPQQQTAKKASTRRALSRTLDVCPFLLADGQPSGGSRRVQTWASSPPSTISLSAHQIISLNDAKPLRLDKHLVPSNGEESSKGPSRQRVLTMWLDQSADTATDNPWFNCLMLLILFFYPLRLRARLLPWWLCCKLQMPTYF